MLGHIGERGIDHVAPEHPRRRDSRVKAEAANLDLQLPDGDGLGNIAKAWAAGAAGAAVIVIAADGSLSRAITAMRIGAFDFLVKPVAGGRLLSTIASTLALQKIATPAPRRPVKDTSSGGATTGDFHGFVGSSPVMREVFHLIERVAPPARASS